MRQVWLNIGIYVYREDAMTSFFNKTRVLFLISLVLTFLWSSFWVFQPLSKEIKKRQLVEFTLLAETKIHAFHELVDRHGQSIRTLSSRTMIKNALDRHLRGELSLTELKAFTKDKYLDGVQIIDHLVYANRITKGQLVAEYYTENYEGKSTFSLTDIDELTFFFSTKNGRECLEIISPIYEDQVLLGHDVAGFCLNLGITGLNGNDVLPLSLKSPENSLHPYEGYEQLYQDGDHLFYVAPLSEEKNIYVTGENELLFQDGETLIRQSLLRMIVGYTMILILFYLLLLHLSKKQLLGLTKDRDQFKEKAHRDLLTGAYTRQFLQEFLDAHPYEEGYLILFDLDDFKAINDTHGHPKGDEVITVFASAVLKSIRAQDLLIRYGGDEFLLILRDTGTLHSVDPLLKRIDKHLATYKDLPIVYSHGQAEISSMETFSTALKEADEKLYEEKNTPDA